MRVDVTVRRPAFRLVLLRPHEAQCRSSVPRERRNHLLFAGEDLVAAARAGTTACGVRVDYDPTRGLLFPVSPRVVVEVDAARMGRESVVVPVDVGHGRVGRLCMRAYHSALKKVEGCKSCPPRIEAWNPEERFLGSSNEACKVACNEAFVSALAPTAKVVVVLDAEGLRTAKLVAARCPEAAIIVPNPLAYENISGDDGLAECPRVKLVDATVEDWLATASETLLDGLWLDYCGTFGPAQRDAVISVLRRGMMARGAPLAVTWCTRRRPAVDGDLGDFLTAFAPDAGRAVGIAYRGMRFHMVHL